MKLSNHLHLVLRLRMSGALPLVPLYASMAYKGTALLLLQWHVLKSTNHCVTFSDSLYIFLTSKHSPKL
jgi:hypothetical protein